MSSFKISLPVASTWTNVPVVFGNTPGLANTLTELYLSFRKWVVSISMEQNMANVVIVELIVSLCAFIISKRLTSHKFW